MKKASLFLLIAVVGCSSNWKKKDFEKELNKPMEEAAPSVEADPKLLKKFEVQTVEEVKPAPVVKVAAKKNEPAKKTVEVKAVVKKETPKAPEAPAKKSLPADYPAELLAINTKAQKVWSAYKSNHITEEKIYLDIHYLGMTVGKIMVSNKGKKLINGKEHWHFHARFKSAPFYSSIYELDDTVDTYVSSEQFLSSRFSLIQRESKQDIDDLQLHDRDQMKTFSFYKQKKSDGTLRNKEKEDYIPFYSIDPFSILFFYQGLPLKAGDVYEIPIINKARILILRSEVEGSEKINTELGEKKAVRVHATTTYTGETLKSGDMYFWFSDDEKRTLLKAQAKIKIGSVTADIVDN